MASFELVDETREHGMLVVGPDNLDVTFAETPGSNDTHLVGVDDPMELVGQSQTGELGLADIAPHPRFAHLGDVALVGSTRRSE